MTTSLANRANALERCRISIKASQLISGLGYLACAIQGQWTLLGIIIVIPLLFFLVMSMEDMAAWPVLFISSAIQLPIFVHYQAWLPLVLAGIVPLMVGIYWRTVRDRNGLTSKEVLAAI